MEEEKEQCFCQSYYDDNNILQDCTCGKCEKKEEKTYVTNCCSAPLRIDEEDKDQIFRCSACGEMAEAVETE